MLSLQEAVQKDQVKEQLDLIEKQMDSYAEFHPTRASILNVQKPSLRAELQEMLRTIPLREFLIKGGDTSIVNAAYMVPDKLHVDLIGYSHLTDKVPLFSSIVDGWEGGDLKVNIVSDETYKPKYYVAGGAKPTMTVQTEQATITPKTFGIPILITTDLIEDAAYGMIDWHLKQAAMALGDFGTDLALNVLKTGTDGWGAINNSLTGDADETRLVNGTTADIGDAVIEVGDDRFIANTMIITPSAWGHSVATQASEVGWVVSRGTGGYDLQLSDLDVIKSTSIELHDSTDAIGAAMTACITLIFDRNHALLTGRKRWLKINNYAKPIEDLAGATISCRQDSVSLYNDSIFRLTET